MGIPVTPEDFRLIGQRFASEDIVAEIDRLLPLAKKDADGLAGQEYDAAQLQELEGYRTQLTGESGDRRLTREQKKGSLRTEIDAILKAKRLLRSATGIAARAMARRKPPQGESAEDTRRIADSFEAQLDAAGGRVGLDSARIRTRLTSVITILEAPELAPLPTAATARAALVASLKADLSSLPALAELKKGLQATSLADTGALDEIDGRAYTNLKSLASAGRSFHILGADPSRAGQYNINGLHRATRKRAANQQAGPARPTPPATPDPAKASGT